MKKGQIFEGISSGGEIQLPAVVVRLGAANLERTISRGFLGIPAACVVGCIHYVVGEVGIAAHINIVVMT